jgi:AcrR family transcriptional regulator
MKRTYESIRAESKRRKVGGASGHLPARPVAGIPAVHAGAKTEAAAVVSAAYKRGADTDLGLHVGVSGVGGGLDRSAGFRNLGDDLDSTGDFRLSGISDEFNPGKGAVDPRDNGTAMDIVAVADTVLEPRKSSRVRILEAALQLFGAQGFEATSVRDLAAVAEVNLAAVNYHFRSKENLRLDALRYGFSPTLITANKMNAALLVAKRTATVEAAEDALVQFIHLFVKEVVGPENKHWAMFLRERLNPGPALEMVMREYFDPLGSALGGILRLLLPNLPQDRIHLCITSIIGQCVHIRMAAPTIKFFSGHDASSPEFLDRAALHIAEFSVLAVRGMRGSSF